MLGTGGASTDTMAHSTQAAHGHMQDHEGHVLAVEADLEYWRTKRLEPRVLQLHRRGVVALRPAARRRAYFRAADRSEHRGTRYRGAHPRARRQAGRLHSWHRPRLDRSAG